MKLEQQVVSLPLAKRLKELGVKQKSECKWMEYTRKTTGEKVWALNGFGGWNQSDVGDGNLSGRSWDHDWNGQIATFTVAELGEAMKEATKGDFLKAYCEVMDIPLRDTATSQRALVMYNLMTEPDIVAQMLIYLIENKLLTNL